MLGLRARIWDFSVYVDFQGLSDPVMACWALEPECKIFLFMWTLKDFQTQRLYGACGRCRCVKEARRLGLSGRMPFQNTCREATLRLKTGALTGACKATSQGQFEESRYRAGICWNAASLASLPWQEPCMSYVQNFWQAKRTWLLCNEFSRGHSKIPKRFPRPPFLWANHPLYSLQLILAMGNKTLYIQPSSSLIRIVCTPYRLPLLNKNPMYSL